MRRCEFKGDRDGLAAKVGCRCGAARICPPGIADEKLARGRHTNEGLDIARIAFQGMLYSAAGQLEEAASAFREALTMDEGLASAHAFGGYNTAFLGRAWETLQAVERAMHLNSTHSRYSTLFFFGGFAELLLGRTEAAIALLNRSLQHNPTYAAAQFFLMTALLATGRRGEIGRAHV